MTLSISLSSQAETKLKERAAAEGKDVVYASELVENAVTKPTLDEILAPFRREVDASRMTDQRLDQFYDGLRDEAWKEGHSGRA
jgi:hypothetical protein